MMYRRANPHSRLGLHPAHAWIGRLLWVALLTCVLGMPGCALRRQTARVSSQDGLAPTAIQQTVVVDRGDVADTLRIGGQMKVRRQVELVFELPAGIESTLESLLVEQGQEVQAGQIVATIQRGPLERGIEEAQIALQAAQSELDRRREPASESALALGRLAVVKARLDLEKAQKSLDDLQTNDLTELEARVADAAHALALVRLDLTVAKRGDVVGRDLRDLEYTLAWQERRLGELEGLVAGGEANLEEQALLQQLRDDKAQTEEDLNLAQEAAARTVSAAGDAVASAEQKLAEARDELAKAQRDPEPLEITRARSRIESARISLARAEEKQRELEAGPDPEDLADARAEVAKAQGKLDDLTAALGETSLTAPFAGVISSTPLAVGDPVTGRTAVIVLNDLSTMRAVAQVDEVDIMRIREGMIVQATFDAFPDEALQGVVGPVPLEASTQDQYSAATYYEVPVEFDYGDLPLKPDMSVTLGFEIRRADSVLRLPTMALQTDAAGTFVEVLRAGDVRERVAVQTGVSDGLYTEIIAGLEEGDEVLVPVIDPAGTDGAFGMFGG